MNILSYLRIGMLAYASTVALWQSPSVAMGQPNTSNTDQLITILGQAMISNPDILAAEAAIKITQAQLEGARLPLNNPELEFETERAEGNSYTIGVKQTLDWHDKQGSYLEVAQTRLNAAQQALMALKLRKASELLDAIGNISTQKRINELAKRRSETLSRFVLLAEKRHSVGDISIAELELARLSRAEAIMQQVKSGVDLIKANSAFFALSGVQLPGNISLPARLELKQQRAIDDETTIRNHPNVQAAHNMAQVVRQKIRLVDQERKADPTFGLSTGRTGNENLVSLSVSIPLQIRNNFQNDVDAARAESLQSDHEAQVMYRNSFARLQAARARYKLIDGTWMMWMSLGEASLQQSLILLEKQWQAGETNTTDYLLQMKQSLETSIAGAELQGERWSAWIEWLSASAYLNDWLYGATKEQ
ncbi:TolC family protein [Sedimenticola selenatireducens]|nr:TolC family protein [Sedimenticola selenatireducens]